MVESENQKLDELLKLEKENNEILRGVRKRQRWATFFHILYWLVIGGIAVASYHFLQPYLESLFKAYSTIQDSIGKITGQ